MVQVNFKMSLTRPVGKAWEKNTFLANLTPIKVPYSILQATIPIITGSSWSFTTTEDAHSGLLAPGTAEFTTTGVNYQDAVHYNGDAYYYSFDNLGVNYYINWGSPLAPATTATLNFNNGPWSDGHILGNVQTTFPITGNTAIAVVYRRPDSNIVLLKGLGLRITGSGDFQTSVVSQTGITRLVCWQAVSRIFACVRFATGVRCYANAGTAGTLSTTTSSGAIVLTTNDSPVFRGLDWNSDGVNGVYFFLYRIGGGPQIVMGKKYIYATNSAVYSVDPGTDPVFHITPTTHVSSVYKTSDTTAIGFYPTLTGMAVYYFTMSGTGNDVVATVTKTTYVELIGPMRDVQQTSVGYFVRMGDAPFHFTLFFDRELQYVAVINNGLQGPHAIEIKEEEEITYIPKAGGFIAHPGVYKGVVEYL